MDERGIIIADKDGRYREELAKYFEDAGYAVETTDSAVHVLCSILEKQTPVLLLGSDFDKKVCSADLVHLLKKCNRNLHVILVTDDLPLAQARRVREEGIFYHALKPASAGDTAELGQAVECAFSNYRGGSTVQAQPEPERSSEEWPAASRLSGEVCSCGEENGSAASGAKTIWWFVGLVVLILGTSCLSLVAAERAAEGSSMAIWLFLSFCALIIATQLMPIFRVKLPQRWWFGKLAKQHDESHEKK